jgi:hypothetical protein
VDYTGSIRKCISDISYYLKVPDRAQFIRMTLEIFADIWVANFMSSLSGEVKIIKALLNK